MNSSNDGTRSISASSTESFGSLQALGIESFGLWNDETGGIRMCACRTETEKGGAGGSLA